MSAQFERIVDRVSAALWNLRPGEAVYLGKHEYDGVVPDLGAAAVEVQLERLHRLREQLRGLEGLDQEAEFDRLQLGTAVDKVLFDFEIARWWRRNPMAYIGPLEVDLYLNRGYAPLAVRVERMAEVLEQAAAVLGHGRENLEPVVPRTYCEWGMLQARGLAEFLEDDLPGEVADLGGDPVRARLGDAAAAAAGEFRSYAGWIEETLLPAADESFPVGGAALEAMLSEGELLDLSLADLAALGEADLAANLEAFRETAAALDPDLGPREVYERHVASQWAPAGDLLAAAGEMLEGIRAFLLERDLITVPSEVRPRVAATPRHLRWAFAMMETPGPYETEATEAFYYVSPVEADWDEGRTGEWLKTLNLFALEDISIHEAYPGHYVNFLHFAAAPTEVARRTWSYAFVEGWAHYAEQMMWEEGYRHGDPRFRLAQLAEALVRNCRFVCAIGLHTGEMTVEQATRFFVENAYYEEMPARKEAERGTFDPGYFSYTLGKLQILRLREDCRRAEGEAFSLKRFHDRVLSRGAPPVELLRRLLLET